MSEDTMFDASLGLRQLRRVLAELRDDLAVLTAMAVRRDGRFSALLTEVRAMQAQNDWITRCVRDLEHGAARTPTP